MKKTYEKPSMTIVPLAARPQLLAGSREGSDWLAQAPGPHKGSDTL